VIKDPIGLDIRAFTQSAGFIQRMPEKIGAANNKQISLRNEDTHVL
jgi:hypothetical protein